jgi:hypothetical protein
MTISRLFYANILNRIYFDARVNIAYYGAIHVNITHYENTLNCCLKNIAHA